MTVRPARILVLRGGALGDFIVTLPALRALRERWPDARLELIGYPRVARLALRGGLVDVVHSLDQSGIARFFAAHPVFSEEQAEFVRSFDIVLSYLHDPQGVVRDNLRAAGVRVLIDASPMVSVRHAADHFLAPLESLAIYGADAAPRLAVRRAPAAGPPLLAIHPGSGSPRKNWPLERFLAVAGAARDAGLAVRFMLGEAEQALAGPVRAAGFDVWADRALDELPDLLAGAACYLGNDSGISHLAAACGCRSLVLFGPTDPALWAPRGDVRILRAPGGDLDQLDVAAVLHAVLAPEP